VTASHVPRSAQPGRFLIFWAWAGLVFLSLFAVVYLVWILAPWFA
jgi:hypothetical protein